MKILEYIASQSIVLAQPSHLAAWLHRAQTPINPRILAGVRRSDDDDSNDDPDSIWDDFDAAIYPPRPAMVINESAGYCIIPIVGMVTQGLSVFEQRYFGCCDVDDIGEMIDVAATNPKIATTYFLFDTPGGYIGGVPETAEKIAALTAKKNTVAYTRGMMCSAGYWLAAPCGKIVVAGSSVIGSIGVYCTFTDMTKMADEMGIKVQVFASGKFKGMGEPGTSLTPEQAQLMQARIEKSAAQFKASVSSFRPNIAASTMEGQWFDGDEGISLRLADEIAPDLTDILP